MSALAKSGEMQGTQILKFLDERFDASALELRTANRISLNWLVRHGLIDRTSVKSGVYYRITNAGQLALRPSKP